MPNDVILYLLAEVIRRYGENKGLSWSSYPGYETLMAFHRRLKQLEVTHPSIYGTSNPKMGDVYRVASQYNPE